MKRLTPLLLIGLLGACVPQANNPVPNPVPNTRIDSPVAFYPVQVGLEWTYLPENSAPTGPGYKLSIAGQTSFANQVVYRYTLAGLGKAREFYRQVDASGVRLLGYLDIPTNITMRFDPPIQEYPPSSNLTVGARWGGLSRYSATLTVDGKSTPYGEGSFEYTYTVLGRSTVRVFDNAYDVLRIALERRPTSGDIERAEVWFVPNVGEIRTQEGLQLLGKNFK